MGYPPEVAKIWRSPTFLLDVRDALRQGKSVFTMVDRPQCKPGMTTAVDTAAGTLHLADAAVRLGVRMGARIRFVIAVADLGGITCRLAAPTAAAEGGTEAILCEFGGFVGAEPFDDDDWLFEVKWDGHRCLANLGSGGTRLVSRTGKDATSAFDKGITSRGK